MTTHILGISAFYHDSAAALICDGEIVAAAQEERFTRRKGDHEFPSQSMDFCLRHAGIDVCGLDYVVFYEKPITKFERLMVTYEERGLSSWPSFKKAFPLWGQHRLHLRDVILDQLGDGFDGQILFADHHESHAASAFYPSPFDHAAVLTLDAVGEWATSSIGMGHGPRLEMIQEMRFPHSIGMLYSAFTAYTGFKVNSGEYKMMGLAPYGEPRYADVIMDEIVSIHPDGSITLNLEYFDYPHKLKMTSEKFHDLFGGPPRAPDVMITDKERDIAASIQSVTEEIILRMAEHVNSVTGLHHLTMAGGVALNCVANGRILREGPFDEIWVQPAAGDAGGALGAAQLVWHQFLRQGREPSASDGMHGAFLGPGYTNADIAMHLELAGAIYERYTEEELLERVARMLDDGLVVGWFQGRMEFGPRALGARSIIGDARSPNMQQDMNVKIKFRESFRPFAPSVLKEHVHEIFEMRQGEDSPYMLQVAAVREHLRRELTEDETTRMSSADLRVRAAVPRSQLPAITHVDYSARVQTVDATRHGRYHRLIQRFYELTGCPVVVNTSFNIRGEPIVRTPEEAYRCFMATGIDCLVLEDFLLLKSAQLTGHLDSDAYRSQYALD